MPIFKLTLEKTYLEQGFFNVTRDYDRFVRSTEGPIQLRLGRTGRHIDGTINRHANRNGTPRIRGGPQLRDWFIDNFNIRDVVNVDLSSMDVIVLDKP